MNVVSPWDFLNPLMTSGFNLLLLLLVLGPTWDPGSWFLVPSSLNSSNPSSFGPDSLQFPELFLARPPFLRKTVLGALGLGAMAYSIGAPTMG